MGRGEKLESGALRSGHRVVSCLSATADARSHWAFWPRIVWFGLQEVEHEFESRNRTHMLVRCWEGCDADSMQVNGSMLTWT
eukprot:2299621-Pleurochrysis_carterae.AAC.2